MKRRHFLKGAAGIVSAALPLMRPAIAQDKAARTLRFVPQSNPRNLDPVFQTGPVERQHNHMVWDNLYGLNSSFAPKPQMVVGHTVSDNGLTWQFKLRDGLLFHDGEPVRAADCVASIARWGKRDQFGQKMLSQTDSMKALDDKTFEIKLTRPFPLLAFSLAQDCHMMPERMALTDAFAPITEYIGSGPFRFIKDEYVSGSRLVYEKFDKYVPRSEPPDYLSGGKVVNVDRVEWQIIPDGAAAAGALQKGEIDWIEEPLFDLLPLLRKASGVRVVRLDPLGATGNISFNHLYPPFDNIKLRRALYPAVNQKDYLDAIVGSEPEFRATEVVGVFPLGTPLATTAGLEVLSGPRDLEAAKRLVAQSGYKGEQITLLAISNIATLNAMALVTLDLFNKLGLNVKFNSVDRGAFGARWMNKQTPDKGGWNCVCFAALGLNQANPGIHLNIRTNGLQGSPGWPENPEIEALRDAWFDAPDLAAQKAIAEKMQRATLDFATYIPTCQWYRATALRANVVDPINGNLKVFWKLRKT